MENLSKNIGEFSDGTVEKAEIPQETLEGFGEKATETAEVTADVKNEDAIIANAGGNVEPLPPTSQIGESEAPQEFGTQLADEAVETAETSEDEEAEKKKQWTKDVILRCMPPEALTLREDEAISKEAFVGRGVEKVYKELTWLQDAIESDSDTRGRDFASDMLGDEKGNKKPMLYATLVALGAYEDPAQRSAIEAQTGIANPILGWAATEASRIHKECHRNMASSDNTLEKIRDEALSERNVDAILVGIEKLGDNIEEALSEYYENQQNKPSKKIKESVSKFAKRFGLQGRPEPKDLPEFGTPEQ